MDTRRTGLVAALTLFLLAGLTLPAQAQWGENEVKEPSLTVTGRGQVSVAPDRAVIRLGAISDSLEAGEAQQRVNEIMQRATQAVRDLGIEEENIRTVGLTLSPVYDSRPRGEGPRITGYRAANTIQVRVDDLAQVGDVIDAGVAAGANQLQGLRFEVQDEAPHRAEALRNAVREARSKADAIAEAMGVRLEAVAHVMEQPDHRPMYAESTMMRAGVAADAAGAPVQPGRIDLEASVYVRYRIAQDE